MKAPTKLKRWREAENLTQLELAQKLGVTERTAARYERGESIPPAARCSQIAKLTKGAVSMGDWV